MRPGNKKIKGGSLSRTESLPAQYEKRLYTTTLRET